MTLVGFEASNHPQQTRYAGSNRDVDDRALPAAKFAMLDRRFKFTVDVAASPENAKCKRFYTFEDSGLIASWKGERVYCNPPYSNIAPWIRKAWAEVKAELVVMILPANRTEQAWWQQGIEPYRDQALSPLTVEFVPGRWRFMKPGQKKVGPNERPPFGIVLCIWTR